jgi:predicted negative regulator of RcsB-dependent stress response
MAQDEADEQLERVIEWWKARGKWYGLAILSACVVGIGWQVWQNHQHERSGERFDAFHEVLEPAQKIEQLKLGAGKPEDLAIAETSFKTLSQDFLKEKSDDMPAQLTRLIVAAKAVRNNDIAQAVKELEGLDCSALERPLNHMCLVNLGQLYLTLNQPDKVFAILNDSEPSGFDGAKASLKGDAYRLKGDLVKAREFYDQAIEWHKKHQLPEPLLQIKRDALG